MNKDKLEIELAKKSQKDLLIKTIYSVILFICSCIGIISGMIVAFNPTRTEIHRTGRTYIGFGPLVISKTENFIYSIVAILFSLLCLYVSIFFYKRLSKAFIAEKEFINKKEEGIHN